jgi:hypothetical protein
VGLLKDNHQARATIVLDKPVTTKQLKLVVRNANPDAPVSLFEVRCY